MIPSVKTFCFSRDIPFHVQLCGSAAALREFYGCSAELEKGSRKWQGVVANIRVFLTRQIYVEIFGRESWRSLTIGEGIVRSLPPMGLDELPGETAVDWEGTVRCDDDITCGSFSISHLTVKARIARVLCDSRCSPFVFRISSFSQSCPETYTPRPCCRSDTRTLFGL